MIKETLKKYYESSIVSEIVTQVGAETTKDDKCKTTCLEFFEEDDVDGIPLIGLRPNIETITLDKYTTSSVVGATIEEDHLDAICRNVIQQMFILGERNKSNNGANFPVPEEPIVGVAGTYPKPTRKDGLFKWIKGLVTKPESYSSHSNKVRKVCVRIRQAMSYIAITSRRGAPNFMVVSARQAVIIQDSSEFSVNIEGLSAPTLPMYKIGKMFNMDIYVDPYMAWTDNRVLLGRKTMVDEPGIIFVYGVNDMPEKELINSGNTMAARTSYTTKHKIHIQGNLAHCSYLVMELIISDGED